VISLTGLGQEVCIAVTCLGDVAVKGVINRRALPGPFMAG